MDINEDEKLKILAKAKKWKKLVKLTSIVYFPCWLVLGWGVYSSIMGMINEDKIRLLQGNALTVVIILLIFLFSYIAKLYQIIEKLLMKG